MKKVYHKIRIAWGISGSGDKLLEVIEIMKTIKAQYFNELDIFVYLSKAGELVLKYYKKLNEIKREFVEIGIEVNSNNPSLGLQLQTRKFDFLLIAPATSNTVAKIANGIADTLLTNSVKMALKTFVPVFILPCDFKEGEIITQLPDGKKMNLYIRKEDEKYVKMLTNMTGISVLQEPQEIYDIINKIKK